MSATNRSGAYGPSVNEALFAVDLEQVEREMLAWGVRDWGGPARCTDVLARAMGFDSKVTRWGRRVDVALNRPARPPATDDSLKSASPNTLC